MSLPLIADCVIWLDASDTTTLSSFSAVDVDVDNNKNHTDLVDQGRVGFWANKIGDQYHFTNSWGTTGNRPFYIPHLSAINFTSQDQTYLTADYEATFTDGAQTVFVLTMARDSIPAYRIFTQALTDRHDEQDIVPLAQLDNIGNIGSLLSGGYPVGASTSRAKGKFFVACYNNTSTQVEYSVDSNSPVVFSTVAGNLDVERMRLGARLLSGGLITNAIYTSASTYDGFIREVIVYNKSLTEAERLNVVDYLASKWDLEQHQENAIYALQSGNWDSILWSTSGLPDPDKDTVFANGFNVFINTSLSAHRLTNMFGRGRFIINDGVSLSAFILGGGGNDVACLQFLSAAPAMATLVGNLCAGSENTDVLRPMALRNFSSGDFYIIGNCLGGINNDRFIDPNSPFNGIIQNSFLGTIFLTGDIIGDVRRFSLTTNLNGVRNHGNGNINVVGTVRGGTGGNANGIVNGVAGTVTVIGTVSGGPGIRSHGIDNRISGTVNMTGPVFGGSGIFSDGINNERFSSCNITGPVFGGTGSFTSGAENTGTGVVFINGTATGGSGGLADGVTNSGPGIVIIDGIAVGGIGSNSPGARNSGLGSTVVPRAIGNGWGRGSAPGVLGPSPGIVSTNIYGQVLVQELQLGPLGQWPTAGNIFVDYVENSQLSARGEYYYSSVGDFDTKTESASGLIYFTTKLGGETFIPAVSNVRLGVVYNLGSQVGTIILPAPEVVLDTEPLDDGFGAANFKSDFVWAVTMDEIRTFLPNSIGQRLLQSINIEKAGEISTQMK